MISKLFKIFLQSLTILLMIGLIPLIGNDYYLTGAYVLIIIVSLIIKNEKRDYIFLAFGFVGMIISESMFISTGVETFTRASLLGIMPLWLPFLWAYAFVVMRRAIQILGE